MIRNCHCNNEHNIHNYSCNYAVKCSNCNMRLDLGFKQPHLQLCTFSNGLPLDSTINYNLMYNIIPKEKNKKEEP